MDVKKIYTLHNGVEMPGVGFGTWKAKDGADAYDSIIEALKAAGDIKPMSEEVKMRRHTKLEDAKNRNN